MKSFLALFSTVALGALLFGCTQNVATGIVTPTSQAIYSPTNPDKVELYADTTPKKPYQVIGTVEVDTYNKAGDRNDPEDIRRALKELAASIGGEAVVDIKNPLGLEVGTVINYPTTPTKQG